MRAWLQAGVLIAAGVAAQAGAERVYRVQAGDTLYALARASGTTAADLARRNGLNGGTLHVGTVLRLPGRGAAPASHVRPAVLPARAANLPVYQSGMAVYYGGRRDTRTPLTAAHLSLPFGTWVEVRHARTGRSVLVMINDRGPFGRRDRVIDLSTAAARALGITGEGVAPVTLRIAHRP
ncbi:RlpA-like double-psi beta-barrel domain-containing protein [Deinococcus aquiradiocola]|uniref:RlpA-like double-psi beta-barrel domain-containing protein n=1 Tax=Deinococcus aquiradiocola TaxID=393059 RepID=UPI001E3DD074|nr:RlpA-like double-psi beta-barrel domain-containing protein [Deinococcus aquiradiocola]